MFLKKVISSMNSKSTSTKNKWKIQSTIKQKKSDYAFSWESMEPSRASNQHTIISILKQKKERFIPFQLWNARINMTKTYELDCRGERIVLKQYKGETIDQSLCREFGWLLRPIIKQTKSFEKTLDKLNWKIVEKTK